MIDRWIRRRWRPEPGALAALPGGQPAVVVTGGSRGIGLALAVRFAETGADAVALVARDAGQLDRAAAEVATVRAGVRVVAVQLDITREDAAERLAAHLAEAGLYVDTLVNSAGLGCSGAFASLPPARLDAMLRCNVQALTALTRRFLPDMLVRGTGGVLNVGSLGGLVPGPYQAAYYASKAYVITLTEGIAWEVRGQGVRVAVVAPGPVETGFHAAMGAENALYRVLVPSMTPEAVARSAIRGFRLGHTVIVPGVIASGIAFASRLAPRKLTASVVGVLLRPQEMDRDA